MDISASCNHCWKVPFGGAGSAPTSDSIRHPPAPILSQGGYSRDVRTAYDSLDFVREIETKFDFPLIAIGLFPGKHYRKRD